MTGRLRALRARLHRLVPHRLHPHLPGLRRFLVAIVVAVVGAGVGMALTPATRAEVGPFQADVRVLPSLDPGIELRLPPIGEVSFETFRAPLVVRAGIAQVDIDEAQKLIESPAQLQDLVDTAPDQVRSAAIQAAVRTVVGGLLGALVLSLLVSRRAWRRTAEVAGVVVVALVVTSGVAAATFDADTLAQPRFTGLLSRAPYIAGSAPGLLARFESYRSGLSDIVRSVTTLYATAGDLPQVSTSDDDVVTLLHVSDIHLNPLAFDLIDRLTPQFGVDAVVDTGDIVTWGTTVESGTLSRIGQLDVPYVFVRGNHDSADTARAVAANPNAVVLENGQVAEVAGIPIAGIGDPAFTPDETGGTTTPTSTSPAPSVTGPPPTPEATPTVPTATATTPTPSPATSTLPPDAADEQQAANNQKLAVSIGQWNQTHVDAPVRIAAVHEPRGLEPLLGKVPTVFAGHTHKREVKDEDGTRIMIEGSTGGAGITAGGLGRLSDGEPLPLSATLVYLARTGDRAGQVIAYDEITVGGFGLASVSLDRTVVRDDESAP